MKTLTLIIGLCLMAVPVGAAPTISPCASTACIRGAPAPAIGFGLPAILSVGSVLLGVKLLTRKRSKE
jgi:hypothetical protein